MKEENSICFPCQMKRFSQEKLNNLAFFMERKNEFYPDEEYGEYAYVCENCHKELIAYYLNKNSFL
jgi:hypothetical protein